VKGGKIMGAMKEFEQEIREIVREELLKQPTNPLYTANRPPRPNGKERPAIREDCDWLEFETERCIQGFWEFCTDRAMKSGRNPKSVLRKIRSLLNSGVISTW